MTAVCLLRACLYSPRSRETEGDQFFPCPNTLILGCLLSNQTYVLAPVGVLFSLDPRTVTSVLFVLFVFSEIHKGSRIASEQQGSVHIYTKAGGSFFHNFPQRFLLIPTDVFLK